MGIPAPARGVRFNGHLFWNVSGDSPQGWSETFSLVANSMPDALGTLDTIYEARRPTLCSDCVLVYGYVSDDGVKGDSLLYQPEPGHLLGTYEASEVTTLHIWNTLLLRIEATALYRIPRHLRAIPSDQDLSAFGPGGGGWLTAVTTYLTVLKNQTWARVKIKPLDPTPVGNYRVITRIVPMRWSEHRDGRPFGLRVGRYRKATV